MKRNFLISIIFILFGLNGIAQIRITNPKFDFGDIFEENGLVYADFKLTNPYPTDTIKIKSVETSCGCTAILTQDTIIFPRSIVNLKVSYDPKGRVGLFQKSIKIKTITGKNEQNELYLQIVGNVVPKVKIEKTNPQLIEYKVAPIYFYPITEFDTSYLDFNFIIDFVNDLTYEIDYFQFAKVGFKVKVRDHSKIEAIDYLIRYSKYKFIHEMKDRGYLISQIFFSEPIFEKDTTIPSWSLAQIKAYSLNFNQDELAQSKVKLTLPNTVDNNEFLLDVNDTSPLNVDSIFTKINFSELNKRLQQDSILVLNADFKTPEKYPKSDQDKFKKEIYKIIYKELKTISGIGKKELVINYDSTTTHASTMYQLRIWQNKDLEKDINVKYQVKKDNIIPPLLPTYKQKMIYITDSIETMSTDFKQFWNCLLTYQKSYRHISLMLETSCSNLTNSPKADLLSFSDLKAKKIKKIIQTKYYLATGHFITVNINTIVSGPQYSERKMFTDSDYFQYDYFKLIPIYKSERKLPLKPISPRPYVVNYDYYFIGIDTTSFVFKKFANYLIYEIQKYGYVELKTESSASFIPVDRRKSNLYLAYKHLEESKKRLYDYLSKRLVDPNRILISDERIMEQGIPYHKKTPIVRYRKYQYVTFVPAKYISNR